jgi:hypothetical protein
MHHLAVEIAQPVAIDDAREEQSRDQEEVRHAKRLGEGDGVMHPALAAGSGLHAERGVHHHHHDDADSIRIIDPVDPSGGLLCGGHLPFQSRPSRFETGRDAFLKRRKIHAAL